MEVKRTKTLSAAKEVVWGNLKNFAAVQNYHPTVTVSKALNDQMFGVGAERSCTFTDGNTIGERIIKYEENKGYEIEIFDLGKMPLKYARAHLGITELSDGKFEAYMSMDFRAKMGPLGWIMERTMMRKAFDNIIRGILDGLDTYSNTGEPIGV